MEKEFLHLINSHRGIIYKVCNLYARDREFKEDLFQDIVFQLWRSYQSFKGESQITTWMYRVALNTAISQFRKDVRMPARMPLSTAEFQIPEIEGSDAESDQKSILKQAIAQLTEVEKALIMLYLEEKRYSEISDIMGISQSNVGVKLNRIKQKLEKIIKQQNYESR